MKRSTTKAIDFLLDNDEGITEVIIKKGGSYWRYFSAGTGDQKKTYVLPFERVLTNEQVETLRRLTNSVDVDMTV
jgi:hypothetical protein